MWHGLCRHDEAQQAYTAAGKAHMASSILEQLFESSVTLSNFSDASYFCYQLAMEALDVRLELLAPVWNSQKAKPHSCPGLQKVTNSVGTLTEADRDALEEFSRLYGIAEIYYAYSIVNAVTSMPFRDQSASVVFNAARFLFMRITTFTAPAGVSLSTVVFVLAQEAEVQEAWKLARFAYLRLQSLQVRPICDRCQTDGGCFRSES